MTQQSEALRLADWLEDQYDPTYNQEQAAAELRRLHNQIAACEPYLKEGETPAERIERDHKDSLALMTLLAREKTKNDALQNTKHYEAPRGFVLNPDYLVPELRAQRDALLEALRKHVYLHDKDCVCEDCAAIKAAEENT